MLLLVHGGAGKRRPTKKALKVLTDSLEAGYGVLHSGSALEAVVESIRILEDSGFFNAGTGGNLQMDGQRRLDASVMEGENWRAGSVVGIEGIRNPVKVARALMDFPHVMMTNAGARKIAMARGLALLPGPDEWELQKLKKDLKKEKRLAGIYREFFSTVGAVAVDANGNFAAGASTGGISAMLPGRVGDTPVIGAGIYAENGLGAVSCTGMGESILRLGLAKEICMNLKSITPYGAARLSLKRILRIGGMAGVIVIDSKGRSSLVHTTQYMACGRAGKKGVVVGDKWTRIRSSS